MSLPLLPPLEPMLARAQPSIPPGMAYEPKWDGFRALIFRDGDQVSIISRNGRDLSRYFPEVVESVRAETPEVCVLDGELVVSVGDRLDFDRLTERIHPAASRVAALSVSSPAQLVCWDLLCLGDDVLMELPFRERRGLLVRALTNAGHNVFVTPITSDLAIAEQWFTQFEGAGLDGIVAKSWDGSYQPGRRAMVKVKHAREADVVVAGYRLHRNSTANRPLVGSLQLGLYDGEDLHFVGVAASFPESTRAQLATELGAITIDPDDGDHPWSSAATGARRPGAVTRWTTELKETLLIAPQLVCAVGYEHLQGTRFRHTAQFLRWRPDREPGSCTFEQLEEVPRFDLASILTPR